MIVNKIKKADKVLRKKHHERKFNEAVRLMAEQEERERNDFVQHLERNGTLPQPPKFVAPEFTSA